MQPAAGLLALKTGRPVRIHYDRQESTRAGIKRHPIQMFARTGCDAEGRLIAHQLHAVLDTGAYASLGPAVLTNFSDHAAAPLYRIPHVDVQGQLVYTNNSVAGAFRGFGGNQATFAVESQLDKLAGSEECLEAHETTCPRWDDLESVEAHLDSTTAWVANKSVR